MAEMTSYTLRDMLEQSANNYTDLPAVGLADESIVFSFTALLASVKEVSNHLHAQGVVPGDRIAVLGENSPNWGIIYFAITCMGAVAVPILPDFSRKEVSTILDHAGIRGLAVTRRLFEKGADFVRVHPETLLARLDDLSMVQKPLKTSEFGKAPSLPMTDTASTSRVTEGEFLAPRPREEDLACLIYTSGTTGQSKGVMLTHRNITWMLLLVWMLSSICIPVSVQSLCCRSPMRMSAPSVSSYSLWQVSVSTISANRQQRVSFFQP